MTGPEAEPSRPAAEIHRPVLRGWQPVEGLWFPAGWFDDETAAARILAAWRPGSRVHRFETGWLLRFAAAIELDCDQASGWPLRREGTTLSSAPASAVERALLPAADAWIVLGARVMPLQLSRSISVDPSAWLEIDLYALHESYDCRAAVVPSLTAAVAEPRDLRSVLGTAIPPASAAQREFLRELARARDRRTGEAGDSGGAVAGIGRAAGRVARALAMLGLGFALALAGGGAAPRGRARPVAPATGPATTPSGRSIRPRRPAGRIMPQHWRDWLTRLAVGARLADVLGRRQAAYLQEMLAMFERGDLDQALRHAVPLGTDGLSLGQAFGTPSARQALTLSTQMRAGPTITIADEVTQRLRALYRQSFDTLDRAGRIDEAVFVLAELLNARQEALDYLEKCQRFTQAAELALAWDMPPDQIVRLHCLAGDWRTALAVARRDDAFANAITLLGPKWPDAALRLRREWAETLAARGHWLQAVDAIWPIAPDREQAIAWLCRAEAAGGALGARGLVRRAALLPDTVSVHAGTLTLLRDDPAASSERGAVAEAILAQTEQSAATRRLAGLVLGPILADHARGEGRFERKLLRDLVGKAGDPLFAADLPGTAMPGAATALLSDRPAPLELAPPEPGARAVFDAVPLEAGRYLLAIGEAGTLLVDRFGRTLARFAVPTRKLVIAESRQIALALVERDGMWRVSRLDLANRSVTDLGMLPITHFAGEFDGIGWTVALEHRVCVLDTTGGLRTVLWQVSDLPGRVVGLTHVASFEQFLLAEGANRLTLWKYLLPSRRLVSRDDIPAQPTDVQFRALNPFGGYLEGWIGPTAQGVDALHLRQNTQLRQIPLRDGRLGRTGAIACCAGEHWTFARLSAPGAATGWHLIAQAQSRVAAEISWPETAGADSRLIGGDCILFDGEGRVLHVDTLSSRVVSFALR